MILVPIAPHLLATVGVAGLVGWRVYRRVRRSIGRQRVRPVALGATIGVFGLLALALAALNADRAPLLEGLAAGLVGGVVAGLVGLRLTRFESSAAGAHYVPNTALGIAVSVLFIGRLLYRLVVMSTASGGFDAAALRGFGSSPLTLACFGLVAGYYVTSAIGVLWWYRGARAATPAGDAASRLA